MAPLFTRCVKFVAAAPKVEGDCLAADLCASATKNCRVSGQRRTRLWCGAASSRGNRLAVVGMKIAVHSEVNIQVLPYTPTDTYFVNEQGEIQFSPHLVPIMRSQSELKGDDPPQIIINFMRVFGSAQFVGSRVGCRDYQFEEKIPLRWSSGLSFFLILHISASVLTRHGHSYWVKVF